MSTDPLWIQQYGRALRPLGVDVEQLKKAAQAATSGRWTAHEDDLTCDGEPLLYGTQEQEGRFILNADADYAAAARPEVALELIARIEKAEDALRTAEDALANCYDVTAYPGKDACAQGDALDAVRDALNGSHVVMTVCPKCFECFDPTNTAPAEDPRAADAAEFAKLQTHLTAHHSAARPSAPAGLAAWALAALEGAELARTEAYREGVAGGRREAEQRADNSRADALTDDAILAKAKHRVYSPRGAEVEHYDFSEQELIAFARDILAASPVSQPAAASIPYDGLTEEFADEVARLANDAPGIREAIAGALESCKAIIAPKDGAAPAPSPADERAAQELLPIDRKWVTAKAVSLVAEYRNCKASETEEVMQRFVDYMQAALQDAAARAASASETGAEGAAIPAGYALVPIVPTTEMLGACKQETWIGGNYASRAWKAMIAAAPQPAQADAQDVPADDLVGFVYVLENPDRPHDPVTRFSRRPLGVRSLGAKIVSLTPVYSRPAQADARVRLTADERNALNEAVKQLPSISAMRTLRDKILAAHQDQPEPRAEVTEAEISAAARVLSDSNADLCYVDRDDNWKIHGDEFRIEAKTALEAAAAARTGASS